MDIKVAKQEISNSIRAYLSKNAKGEYLIPTIRQRPILLIGPPGIGKTAIMEQVASENKVALVSYTMTHHTRESAIGIPQIVNMHYNKESFQATEYTMSEIITEIYRKMNSTNLKEGILFLDEINCVDQSLAPAILRFLQCKTFGTHRIPDGWVVAAAGNPKEYNSSVREFDIVTLDRLKKMEIEPNFEVWREYAYSSRINTAIISFLYNRPENFYSIDASSTDKTFVTARGWQDLSDMLNAYEGLKLDVTKEFVLEYIQYPDIANEFIEYYSNYVMCINENKFINILTGQDTKTVLNIIDKLEPEMKNAVMIYIVQELANTFYECDYQKLYSQYVVEMAAEVGRLYEKSRSSYRSDTYSVTEGMRQELDRQIEANFLTNNEISAMRNAIKFVDDIALKYASGASEMLYIAEIYEEIQKEFEPIKNHYQEFFDGTKAVLKNICDFVKKAFKGKEYDAFMHEMLMNKHITEFIRNELADEYGDLLNYTPSN